MTESTAFMRNLRPRGTLPRPQRTNRARPITIKHPGYALAEDLLCFPAYDGTSVPGLWGCSHLLVLDACRIIANNRDGFLSKTPRRSGRISTGERTLTASVYYYFLDDDRDAQYPVNARFDTWSFPDRLPTHWLSSRAVPSTSRRNHGTSESDVSASLQIVGDTCVLSGERRGQSWEDAHLVPSEQGFWFLGHKMWLHSADPRQRPIDDPANTICLHPELLDLFDRHAFVFFPSKCSAEGQYVAYFIQPEHAYAQGFHRVKAHIPESNSPEFIYARFALSVLSNAKVSRDAVKTVGYSVQYEAELTALLEARFGREPEPHRAPNANAHSSQERERLEVEAARRQSAVEDAFYSRYPHLRQEVTHSDDPDYQTLVWHPEADRMQKLAAIWFDCNPQIRQSSHSGRIIDVSPDSGVANGSQ